MGVHIKNNLTLFKQDQILNNIHIFLSSPPMDTDAVTTPISTVRRRNSIETPSNFTLHTDHHHPTSSSSSPADFELVSLKPVSYTSLRDILPTTAASVQSPKVPSFVVHPGYEISIRNRLVKQAAWAYLQPVSISPDSDGTTIFHRLWTRFSDAFVRLATGICDCFLRSVQIRSTSSRL
ncbi:hypothetical protein HanPI659440_Chr15g0614851 [Helianthus annuus]|nr:hypothetical protein HanPI659440_Chr15g0614851 [Helianthus annuus]